VTRLIGMDVGTTRVKAVAFDAEGVVLAVADHPTPWHHTPDGVEMDPADLEVAVCDVLSRASDGLGPIHGIGVTGMGESGVLTAAATGPDSLVSLAPIRAWHDARADVETVRAAYGVEGFQRVTGMPLDPQPSLPKILRLRNDCPATAEAVRFWSVPEWVVHLLAGSPGSELSLASRTGLLDVLAGSAWSGAIDLLGIDLLGEPQVAGTSCGVADPPAGASQVGGAVLAIGGHDHPCAALAAGAARHGTLFDSLGTAEALLRFTDLAGVEPATVEALVAAGLTVGRTVVAGQLCIMAGLRTGMQLERAATALGATTRAQRRALAADPGWAVTVAELVDGARPALEAIRAAVGQHTAVLGAGGWLHDTQVLAAKRRQFPGLVTTSVEEAGAAGAAYLAGVAAGLLPSPDQLDGPPWPTTTTGEVP